VGVDGEEEEEDGENEKATKAEGKGNVDVEGRLYSQPTYQRAIINSNSYNNRQQLLARGLFREERGKRRL